MRVFPANNTKWIVHYWAGRYGNLGHLYSPTRSESPFPHLPYALDNGAWIAFKNRETWRPEAFLRHVDKYAHMRHRPLWVVAPDVVGNAIETLDNWEAWRERLAGEFELLVALAVQDGMESLDLSAYTSPDLLFVGGSTWAWKRATIAHWCALSPRVHVGRVNTAAALDLCEAAGVESCDGTGWFKGRAAQLIELGEFLANQAGKPNDPDLYRTVELSRYEAISARCFPMEVSR